MAFIDQFGNNFEELKDIRETRPVSPEAMLRPIDWVVCVQMTDYVVAYD